MASDWLVEIEDLDQALEREGLSQFRHNVVVSERAFLPHGVFAHLSSARGRGTRPVLVVGVLSHVSALSGQRLVLERPGFVVAGELHGYTRR